MAEWDEVRSVVRTRFQLDLDAAEEFALTLPQGNGEREQRVMVRRFQKWNRWLVEIRSAFGELGTQDAEGLLRDVLQLPIGGIALHGRFLVVVHRELLDDLPLEGLLFLIARVAQAADALEARTGEDRF
jgi:hypothetical protein